MYARTTESNGTSRFLSAHANRHPFLRGLLVLVALLIAVSLGGCDSGGPTGSTPPDSPADAGSTLGPGGTASTDSGVRVMASKGAIDDETSVSGSEMADPTSETPMPDFARPSGPYHRVASGRNVEVATDEPPLYLALPVPEGADTSRLALAVRIPQKYTTDNAQARSEYGWSVVRGAYEPERGLLVTPIRFLMKRGTAFTVVESDDHTSPSMAGIDGETLFAKTQNFFSQNAKASAMAKSTAKSNRFVVKCVGFENSSACGADEKKDVRQYLKKATRDFVGGFQSPALPKTFFGNKPVWKIYESGEGWCEGAAGKYLFLTDVAITCYNGTGDPSEGTTRHEFFHAIQYSYAPISLHNWPVADWILEGTAELAEPSSGTPLSARARTSGDWGSPRNVDVSLTESNGSNVQYRAQDFWVYLINSRRSTLAKTLRPVYKASSNVPNEPTRRKVAQLYSLSDKHWSWVQNQAFESRVTAGNSDLNGACIFNSGAVGSVETINYNPALRDAPVKHSVELSALTAEVAKVNVRNSGSKRVLAKVKATSSGPSSYAKVYYKHTSPTSACWNRRNQGSSAKLGQNVSPDGKTTFYVLMSNSNPKDSKATFTLKVTHQVESVGSKPNVKITSPPAGGDLQRNYLTLKANASDPDGGSIDSYEWKITDGENTVTYKGNDISTDYLWGELSPGTLKIEVTVTDDEAQQATTSITTEVRPEG